MTIFRESAQRKAILENLSQRYDHPPAAHIYSDLRKKIPNLSLGTVYRNLEILEQQGRIRSLRMDPKESRFDAQLKPHAHFACRQCGSIEDIPLTNGCCHFSQTLEKRGYRVEKRNIDLVGICQSCNQSKIN